MAHPQPVNELEIRHETFSRKHRLFQGGAPVYYTDISVYTPGKPDVTLLDGSESGPVVGVARFHKMSNQIDISLDDLQWESMESTAIIGLEYAWPTTINGQPMNLAWKRTHDVAAYGGHKTRGGNLKLVDTSTSQMVALELAGILGEKSRLLFFQQFNHKQDATKIVLAVLSLLEKDRRRKAASSAGGASASAS